MRHPWTLVLVGVVLSVAPQGVAWAQRAQPSRRAARPATVGETRWYGAEPHVPMAWVSAVDAYGQANFASPDLADCAAWSRVGQTWTAVDRWGQVVRSSRLVSRDYYDATGCFETTFDAEPPHPARYDDWRPGQVVLYARGGFRPSPSAEWSPTTTERAEHDRFLRAIAPLVLRAPTPAPADAGAIFFRAREPRNGAIGNPIVERRFAVSGGRALIVAERLDDGRWVALYLDATLGNARSTHETPYQPLAVFDMNGDGRPEVVFHDREGGGEFFGDAVLSLDASNQWRVAARSRGGSTA